MGPGHGKTIISSYVVANEETVRRGVMISFIAAGMQAFTAVALVALLLFGLNASGLQINAWSNQLESVSYAMIALVGVYLLATQFRRLWRSWRGVPAAHAAEAHGHGEHHHHDHAGHDHHHASCPRHPTTHHHHHHHHAPGEACDHIVDARQLAGPFSWRKVMAVVFSVGIRPCTGAILVLVFAVTQGLFWAGVAATFAMAFGTAITVAALATLALGSRELALKLGGTNSTWSQRGVDHLHHRRGGGHLSVRNASVSRVARSRAAVLDSLKRPIGEGLGATTPWHCMAISLKPPLTQWRRCACRHGGNDVSFLRACCAFRATHPTYRSVAGSEHQVFI